MSGRASCLQPWCIFLWLRNQNRHRLWLPKRRCLNFWLYILFVLSFVCLLFNCLWSILQWHFLKGIYGDAQIAKYRSEKVNWSKTNCWICFWRLGPLILVIFFDVCCFFNFLTLQKWIIFKVGLLMKKIPQNMVQKLFFTGGVHELKLALIEKLVFVYKRRWPILI